ncbi:MAG: Fic family protein [Vampirovibrio sp.]
MPVFIHEQPEWPRFVWDEKQLMPALLAFRHAQGRLLGKMESLFSNEGNGFQEQALLETLTQDVIKTSEIEGESLSRLQVRSSVAHRLGVDIGGLLPADRHVDGIVELVLDTTQHWQKPLNEERLTGWHAALFPTGRSGLLTIRTGAWRDDSHGRMQVVSGAYGREKVHYIAPEASRLPAEMAAFLAWVNQDGGLDLVLKAGIAHFWFITLHPFDDGNGRIARAITDYFLAKSEQTGRRFYSLSSQIQQERADYYRILEESQKSTLDITSWLAWYLACLGRALQGSETLLQHVIGKASVWRQIAPYPVNERQRKVLSLLLESFEGKLTTGKWAKLCKCSQDTAARDVAALVKWGVLKKGDGGGRSTHYELVDAMLKD